MGGGVGGSVEVGIGEAVGDDGAAGVLDSDRAVEDAGGGAGIHAEGAASDEEGA